jgi:hypothetical protein
MSMGIAADAGKALVRPLARALGAAVPSEVGVLVGARGTDALARALEKRHIRCRQFLATNNRLLAPALDVRHGSSLADREPVRTRSWPTLKQSHASCRLCPAFSPYGRRLVV